jgi:hypothetical protein
VNFNRVSKLLKFDQTASPNASGILRRETFTSLADMWPVAAALRAWVGEAARAHSANTLCGLINYSDPANVNTSLLTRECMLARVSEDPALASEPGVREALEQIDPDDDLRLVLFATGSCGTMLLSNMEQSLREVDEEEATNGG